jgi:beta-phosphoglucomutase-like phosphatase (HAD superfamily)
MAPSKQHPGMLLQAPREVGVGSQHAVFIGDTTFDMEMARAAKLRIIAVSWGYHKIERVMQLERARLRTMSASFARTLNVCSKINDSSTHQLQISRAGRPDPAPAPREGIADVVGTAASDRPNRE